MNQHLTTVGLEARGGRADSAPTLDQLEPHTDEWKYKRVKFHGILKIIKIPSVGLGWPVKKKVKDTKWHDDGGDKKVAKTVTAAAEAQGEIVENNDSGTSAQV